LRLCARGPLRAGGGKHPHCSIGRGHRPCHGVTPGSGPAGGQSPRPAPAPPSAGASRPPGRALAFRGAWTHRSTGHRRARAGKTRVAFPDPAHTDESTVTAAMAGAIAPATGLRREQERPGAKAPGQRPPRHRRALLARRVGRWPALFPDLPVYREPFRAGGGNAGRVSCSRPGGRKHPHCSHGRGHRPCHSVTPGTGAAGGQSPRPAPAPPTAGASPPPGRTLASGSPGPSGLRGTVARGRWKRGSRFLVPSALKTAPSRLQ